MAACSSPTLLSRKVILRTRWSVRKSKTKPGGWQLIVREHLLRRSTDSSPLPGRLTVKRTCEICCLERSSYDPTRTIGLMRPRIELADDRKSGNAGGRPGFHRSGRRGGSKLREIAEGFQRLLSGDVSWR